MALHARGAGRRAGRASGAEGRRAGNAEKKVPREDLEGVGAAFVDLMGRWNSPAEKCHSAGKAVALRAIASSVIENMEKKPTKALKDALSGAIVSRASKVHNIVKEVVAIDQNPLAKFASLGGRVGSSRWMTDEEIREALARNCRQSRPEGAVARDALPMLRLEGSLIRAINATKALNEVYAESTIYRRVRLHAPRKTIMIGVGKKWTDKCDDCRCWDMTVEKRVIGQVADHMESLAEVFHEYWTGFGEICNEKGYNARGFEKTQSLEWYDDLRRWLEDAPATWKEAREALDEKSRDRLGIVEALFLKDIVGIREEVSGYVAHWTLRDHLHQWRSWVKLWWKHGWIVLESDWGVALLTYKC